MKTFQTVGALLIAVLLFPAFAFAGPSMSYESYKHDFGNVNAGEQLHYEFIFRNEGDEDLQITGLKPS